MCLSNIFFSSSVTTSDAFCISTSPANFNFLISTVTYVPIGFPIAFAPSSFVIFTVATLISGDTSLSSVSTPGISFSNLFAFL